MTQPGQDRVVRVSVRGHEFGYRRPSRADLSDVTRRYALKVTGATGLNVETDVIQAMDGKPLQDEARLEIGLVSRRTRDGKTLALGETAPTHWLVDGVVSFDNVDPEEFDEVVAAIDAALAKKNDPPNPNSGGSAPDPTSG